MPTAWHKEARGGISPAGVSVRMAHQRDVAAVSRGSLLEAVRAAFGAITGPPPPPPPRGRIVGAHGDRWRLLWLITARNVRGRSRFR